MNQVETLQVLRKFCHALIEEIQVQRPEYLTSAFTVAEIYQNLLPYGSNRERIGVDGGKSLRHLKLDIRYSHQATVNAQSRMSKDFCQ